MGMSGNIRDLLERTGTPYDVLPHARTTTLGQAANACELPLGRLARAVVLIDGQGLLMAVLPADHVLDFDALRQLLRRDLELVPGHQLAAIFDDCEPGSYPPLAPAYGLDVVIDSTLDALDVVTFEPGVHTSLIQIPREHFRHLLGGARVGRVSRPAETLKAADSPLSGVVEQFTPARVKRDIEEFHELPALPGTALRILQLASNPLANARQLAGVIGQDPALAAQVLRYANSSLYGYAGRVKDLQTAIARVLGFEFVLNLALGLSIGKALRVPPEGPFGLEAFWRHSVYAARLVEMLARQVPGKQRPARGSAYLAGLLQNLGRLALGHAFQPEFFILNRFAQANPDMPACELERHVLGVSHDQIGAWLMEAWGMPQELVIAVRHHHDEGYWDQYASLPQLVLIANRLLVDHGADAESTDLPQFSLDMLGLDRKSVIGLAERLLNDADELDDLARRLAA